MSSTLHEDDVVGASGIKPEDGLAWLVVLWEVVGPAPAHSQLDPVLDGAILCLTSAIDIAFPDCMPQENLI